MYKVILTIILIMTIFNLKAQNIDPTKPLSSSNPVAIKEVKKGLVLETIIHNKKNKSAIISGKLMKIGDYIAEHELIAVNPSNVMLRSNGENIKLSMFSNVVIK